MAEALISLLRPLLSLFSRACLGKISIAASVQAVRSRRTSARVLPSLRSCHRLVCVAKTHWVSLSVGWKSYIFIQRSKHTQSRFNQPFHPLPSVETAGRALKPRKSSRPQLLPISHCFSLHVRRSEKGPESSENSLDDEKQDSSSRSQTKDLGGL